MEESTDRAASPGAAGDGASPGNGESTGDRAFSLALFRTAAASMPAPVLVLDDEGAVAYANPAVTERLGHEQSDLDGEPLRAVCPSLSLSEVTPTSDWEAAGERLRARGVTADGESVGLELDVGARTDGDGRRWYVVVVQDVSAYEDREQRLEQYERIVQTIDDGVYVLDDAFNITSVNDAVEDLTGYGRDDLVGSNATMLASEETLEQAAAVTEGLLAGDSEAATISTTIQTADGGEMPIETRFSVYRFDDGSYGQVGVLRDVSDRIWYEQTLTALHDSTRELLHAEDETDVCELVVETATDVIDLSGAAVYRFDRGTNVLRPAATADGFDATVDALPLVGPNDSFLWDAFVDDEHAVRHSGDPLALGDGVTVAAETGVAVPLGNHGVFFVGMDADRLDPDTMELIDLVAASAEAALERVDREARLRERDRELRERNERLERVERTNEIIRRIDQALVGADSRAEVQTAVCDQLAASPLFSLAWVGRVEDGELEPDALAGDAPQYLDCVDRSVDGEGGPPGVRTARTGEVTVVPSVVEDLRSEPWRQEALGRGFQSAISVPLAHDGVSHGVLTVYAGDQDAFHDTMRSVFAELAETIANAFRVVETRRWLSAESVVEVDLEIAASSCPLARLAGAADCRLDHEGTVPMADGRNRSYLRVDCDDEAAVLRAADEVTDVESVRTLASDDGTCRFEVHLSAPTVATTLTEQGSRIRSLDVGADVAEATVELAPTASVRDLADALESSYGTTSLGARRERTSPVRGEGGFRGAVEERLTDRQRQVLRTAHLSGFFEWPREATGEDIAESFGVSQPTVNRHLRVGERKLLELLFEDA